MTLTALAADGFQQHVSHSARPPQLHCPAPCRGVLQLRFLGAGVRLTHTVYGKKTALQRAFRQFLPCVLLLPKNFQKFCAVSPFFFFFSTTYWNDKYCEIFRK
jgi:hypothetical protein